MLAAACGGGAAAPPARGGSRRAEEPRLGPLGPHERASRQMQAVNALVEAEALGQRCAADHERAVCGHSREEYRLAADTWNSLLVALPRDPSVEEWSVQRAQAQLGAALLAEAATSARQYLNTGTDATWRKTAAEILVQARARLLAAAEIEVRDAPPQLEGDPPAVRAIDLPQPLADLVEARALYLEVVAEAPETTATRRTYTLENALVSFRYGRWPEARTALEAVFGAGCTGEGAWAGGATAWRGLRDMLLALGRYDAVAELGRSLTERSCTFGTDGAPTCDDAADDPRCIAQTDAASVHFRTGMLLAQRAENERAGERTRWSIRAGEAFLAAVDEDRSITPMDRVEGLALAARAFRLAGSDRAVEIDRRIAAEVVPSRFTADERTRAVTELADALARLMTLARAAARHDEIVQLAQRLLGADFDLPELSDLRGTARTSLPESLVALGKHREASDAWTAVAVAATDPAVQRSANFASALELVAASDCRRATVALRTFARANRAVPGAGDQVVRALYQYAMCQRDRSTARTAAIDDMTAAAGETHDTLGPEARGYVAAAAFHRADAAFDELAPGRIVLARGATTEAFIATLDAALQAPLDEVRQLVEGYDSVARLDDPRWAAAAHYRAGLAIERLADTVLAASWSAPADLEAQRRVLSARSFEQLQGIATRRVREVLEGQARPLRCRAVDRFSRGIAAAATTNVQSPEVEGTRARLAAIGADVITRCRTQRPTRQ